MRITDVTAVNAAKKVKIKKSGSSSGFDDAMSSVDSNDDGQTTSSNISSIAGLSGLVNISSFNNQYQANQEYIDYGRDILSELDKLRLSILSGNMSARSLKNILDSSNNESISTLDPKLQDIIKDIELRAAVELAKITKNE